MNDQNIIYTSYELTNISIWYAVEVSLGQRDRGRAPALVITNTMTTFTHIHAYERENLKISNNCIAAE